MTRRTNWIEPALFTPEELQYERLTARLDFHYDGPRNRLEAWQTITDSEGHWVLCEGGLTVPLSLDAPAFIEGVAATVHREVLRRLSPF